MPYSVKIVLDSVNSIGDRLTTFELTYPKFIHAEFMTHRMFSRNAQSSRAIPVDKLIEQVMVDPVIPVSWGTNQKGMQAGKALIDREEDEAQHFWLAARSEAIRKARSLQSLNVHKQIINRLLEPFSWITVICTATNYENFFGLRVHKDAQPEMQRLAELMAEQYYGGPKPKLLNRGEWHLPYITENEELLPLAEKKMASTARCARVSYLTHDGVRDWHRDCTLHDRLADSGHWSPFEHVAMALSGHRDKNFLGWIQYRSEFDGEVRTFNHTNLLAYQEEQREAWRTLNP